jgi:hypothetical protein
MSGFQYLEDHVGSYSRSSTVTSDYDVKVVSGHAE